jgi:hypothetical protein
MVHSPKLIVLMNLNLVTFIFTPLKELVIAKRSLNVNPNNIYKTTILATQIMDHEQKENQVHFFYIHTCIHMQTYICRVCWEV